MISVDVDSKGKVVVQTPIHKSSIGRRIPGARWSAARKLWYAQPTRLVLEYIAREVAPIASDVSEAIVDMLAVDNRPKIRQFLPTYRFRTTPYKHQGPGTAHMYGRNAAAVFAEPGTGKTKITVDACSALFLAGSITHVLVLCPLSVRSTWKREWAVHSPVVNDVELLGKSMPKFNTKSLRVLVVGIESVSRGRAYELAAEFVLSSGGNIATVVDEAHLIKNHSAKRTQNITNLGHASRHRYILTGTPVSNSLMDYYSQFYFLDPDIIGLPDFYSFRDRYAVMGGYENRQVVGYQNVEELMQSVEPYIFRAKKSECLDLPPKTYQIREVPMLPEQQRFYDKLKANKQAGSVITENVLDLHLRLHQVAGGFEPVVDESGSVALKATWGYPPKIAELMNVLDDAGGQSAIIWCTYRHEICEVAAVLREKYGRGQVVEIHGGISEVDRQKSVDAIQEGNARYIVGTASAGGVGITLTAATLVVYYSNTFSYINRVQSEDRAHRSGQTRKVTIVDLVTPNSIDQSVLAALEAKTDLATWVASGVGRLL